MTMTKNLSHDEKIVNIGLGGDKVPLAVAQIISARRISMNHTSTKDEGCA